MTWESLSQLQLLPLPSQKMRRQGFLMRMDSVNSQRLDSSNRSRFPKRPFSTLTLVSTNTMSLSTWNLNGFLQGCSSTLMDPPRTKTCSRLQPLWERCLQVIHWLHLLLRVSLLISLIGVDNLLRVRCLRWLQETNQFHSVLIYSIIFCRDKIFRCSRLVDQLLHVNYINTQTCYPLLTWSTLPRLLVSLLGTISSR